MDNVSDLFCGLQIDVPASVRLRKTGTIRLDGGIGKGSILSAIQMQADSMELLVGVLARLELMIGNRPISWKRNEPCDQHNCDDENKPSKQVPQNHLPSSNRPLFGTVIWTESRRRVEVSNDRNFNQGQGMSPNHSYSTVLGLPLAVPLNSENR